MFLFGLIVGCLVGFVTGLLVATRPPAPEWHKGMFRKGTCCE